MPERPQIGEILTGLWRFQAVHPDWTEAEGAEDGWEPNVAWWAIRAQDGLVLVDPLVTDWPALDALVDRHDRCAGVVRTCHWHQRTVAEAAERYRAQVWAKPSPSGTGEEPLDEPLSDRAELFDGWMAVDVERRDEIALWLPEQRALVFGDAMLRDGSGTLRACPESWTQPPGGRRRLLALLGALTAYEPDHVLVSHGPLVLGDGAEALRAAVG